MTLDSQELLRALSDPAIGAELHRIVHQQSDKDQGAAALHHTLGRISGQALPHYIADEDFESVDGTIPNPPTGLDVTSAKYVRPDGYYGAEAIFSWINPPLNTDGSDFTDFSYFETEWKRNGDATWTGTVQTEASQVFYFGFTPGEFVDFRVRAVDRAQNKSAWAEILHEQLAEDLIAPPVPSTPTIDDDTFYGIIRVTWDGLDEFNNPMPSDFLKVEVHASTVSGFTPDETTLRDTLFAGGVSDVFGNTGSTLYIVLVAVDTNNNRSDPSLEVWGLVSEIGNTDLIDGIINNAKLALDAVDTANIVDAAIQEAQLGDASVSTNKIAALAVTTAKIDNLAVNNAKIDNLAVTTSKIQLLAVTTALIDNLAVTNGKIDNLAVTDAKINTLTVSKLTAGTLSADVTVSARIKTTNAGARAEMDSSGFHIFNAAEQEVAYLKIVAGVPAMYVKGGTLEGGTITGPLFRTAASGIRMEIGNDWLSDGVSDLNYIVFYMDDADEEHGGWLFANLSPQTNSAEDYYYTTLSSGRFLTNHASTLSLMSGQRTYGTTEDSMATLTAYGDVLNGYITVYGSGRVQLQDVLYVDETTGGTHINRLGVGYQASGTTEYDYSNSAFVVNNSGVILFQGTIQDVDLTNDGQPLTIGKKQASGTQLIIDNNEIQCRVRNAGNTAWTAQNMAINASGGLVSIGNAAANILSCKINDGSAVGVADDTGTLQVGDSTGTNTGFGTNTIQARSGGAATTLNINTNGGRINVSSSGAVFDVAGALHAVGSAGNPVNFSNLQTTTSAANARVNTAGDLLWNNSSAKFKSSIQDLEDGLGIISKLRPISFKPKKMKNHHHDERQGNKMWGFVAEEVHEAGFKNLVEYGPDDEPMGLGYGHVVVPLVKAVQELLARVQHLEGVLGARA